MQLEWWQSGGLLMGIGQAAYLLINQQLKIEPRLLMYWRGFGIAALLLPAALSIGNWPQDGLFYLFAAATGVLVGFFDRLIFQFSAQYGAGIVSRLLALCLPLAFVLWLALHPDHLNTLADKPHSGLLPVALIGTLASVLLLRRDPVSSKAVVALLPLYLLGAGIDVLNKTAMQHGNGLPGFLLYAVIVSFMAGLITLLWPGRAGASVTWQRLRAVWLGGLLIVLVGGAYIVLKASSIDSAPNPAFITALNLTGPFWVMVWNLWRRHPDNTNLWAGFGCVASALLLVFATL